MLYIDTSYYATIYKKEKNSDNGVDVGKTKATIANGIDFSELKERLADIAAKARFDNLMFVQPLLMNDLLNSYKEASARIADAAKLNASCAFSAGEIIKDLEEAIMKYSATSKLTLNPLTFVGNVFSSFPSDGWKL